MTLDWGGQPSVITQYNLLQLLPSWDSNPNLVIGNDALIPIELLGKALALLGEDYIVFILKCEDFLYFTSSLISSAIIVDNITYTMYYVIYKLI